jgi:hypothetical protein
MLPVDRVRSLARPSCVRHVYFYSPDRKAERPASHLEAFRGILEVDGYAGFQRLSERGNIMLAAWWAHTRRTFSRGSANRSGGGSLAPHRRALCDRGGNSGPHRQIGFV